MNGSRPFTKKQIAQRKAEDESREAGLVHLHHEIFSQLMQIPQAVSWVNNNIRISRDIDQEKKTIDVKVMFIGDPTQGEDQLVVHCPNCKLRFDANAEAPQIILATDIPTKQGETT